METMIAGNGEPERAGIAVLHVEQILTDSAVMRRRRSVDRRVAVGSGRGV